MPGGLHRRMHKTAEDEGLAWLEESAEAAVSALQNKATNGLGGWPHRTAAAKWPHQCWAVHSDRRNRSRDVGSEHIAPIWMQGNHRHATHQGSSPGRSGVMRGGLAEG